MEGGCYTTLRLRPTAIAVRPEARSRTVEGLGTERRLGPQAPSVMVKKLIAKPLLV